LVGYGGRRLSKIWLFFIFCIYLYQTNKINMLFTILISVVVVAVVFALVNKFTKKTEKPIEQSPVVEEPLGYETSSLATVEETTSLPVVSEVEEPLVFAKPAKNQKAKMSAKPKAPKKKKNAKNSGNS
jgi:heme/copper-type cytochrome/quinol oxidase subunit 1